MRLFFIWKVEKKKKMERERKKINKKKKIARWYFYTCLYLWRVELDPWEVLRKARSTASLSKIFFALSSVSLSFNFLLVYFSNFLSLSLSLFFFKKGTATYYSASCNWNAFRYSMTTYLYLYIILQDHGWSLVTMRFIRGNIKKIYRQKKPSPRADWTTFKYRK